VEPAEVSDTLTRIARGDSGSVDRLLPVVYAEMRRLAASYLRSERAGHTLQPTALAHEAYLRLIAQRDVTWQNRAHFLGVAALAMRRILVDHARRRRAQRRGGGQQAISLDDSIAESAGRPVAFDDLDRALQALARLNERLARVVELRYIGGLTIDETAEVLGIAPITVKRDWALARAWLYRELDASRDDEA
jgi:RNA polymerase sigma factor (TIGR02999 family)